MIFSVTCCRKTQKLEFPKVLSFLLFELVVIELLSGGTEDAVFSYKKLSDSSSVSST